MFTFFSTNNQFSPSAMPKTGDEASSAPARGKNPPPGAAINPTGIAKTP